MLSKTQAQNASDKDINTVEPDERPTDSVSCISWSPNDKSPTFATSDWGSWIRIYNVDPEASILVQKGCYEAESPCLAVNWHHDEKTVFAGCIDGSVKTFDVESGISDVIGAHEGPVKSLYWLSEANALLTLSFDKTLRFWDPRQAKHVAGFQLHHTPLCSDMIYPNLAIGLSGAQVLLLNLRNIQSELGGGSPNYMESPSGLRTQLTSIKLYSGRLNGIGISGNDGRCNISDLNDNSQTRTALRLNSLITFKAHKIEEGQKKELYPVSSIGFHPSRQSDFCFTAGGEGKMYFWDIKQKDKIAEFDFKGVPITKAEMDPTGRYLAYSLGYDWARGIQGYLSHPSKVCVHVMQDKELEWRYQGDRNYPLKY